VTSDVAHALLTGCTSHPRLFRIVEALRRYDRCVEISNKILVDDWDRDGAAFLMLACAGYWRGVLEEALS